MTNITKFNKPIFGDLIVITDENGSPWFIANEVCELMGIVNSRDSIRKHVKDQHKKLLKYVILDDVASRYATLGENIKLNKNLTMISEGGLYRLIMRTDASKAELFQDWVTDEVLPSIRKTGRYGVEQQKPMSPAQHLLANAKMMLEIEQKQNQQDERLMAVEDSIRQITEGAPHGWGLVPRLATHYGLSRQKGKDLCAAYQLETKKVSAGDYSTLTDMVEIDEFKKALGAELKSAKLSDNKLWFTGGKLGRFQAKGRLLQQYLDYSESVAE